MNTRAGITSNAHRVSSRKVSRDRTNAAAFTSTSPSRRPGGPPTRPRTTSAPMSRLRANRLSGKSRASSATLAAIAQAAGFTGPDLPIAVAVAQAESGGDPLATNHNAERLDGLRPIPGQLDSRGDPRQRRLAGSGRQRADGVRGLADVRMASLDDLSDRGVPQVHGRLLRSARGRPSRLTPHPRQLHHHQHIRATMGHVARRASTWQHPPSP